MDRVRKRGQGADRTAIATWKQLVPTRVSLLKGVCGSLTALGEAVSRYEETGPRRCLSGWHERIDTVNSTGQVR
jgi:hypothetical protein